MKFVIGDIHGEITKLKQLVRRLSKYSIDDLIFVGDYVDKGEDSKATILFLEDLVTTYRCTFLKGDHEYAWLRFFEQGEYGRFLLKYGGKTTMRDFGMLGFNKTAAREKFYQPHQSFFQRLRSHIIVDRFIISHAGINPVLARDLEWETLNEKEFLFHRFDFIQCHQLIKNKMFIFGHTAFIRPYYDGLKIGIDTGAVYQRTSALTAFELENEFFLNHQGDTVKLLDLDRLACPMLIEEEKR